MACLFLAFAVRGNSFFQVIQNLTHDIEHQFIFKYGFIVKHSLIMHVKSLVNTLLFIPTFILVPALFFRVLNYFYKLLIQGRIIYQNISVEK